MITIHPSTHRMISYPLRYGTEISLKLRTTEISPRRYGTVPYRRGYALDIISYQDLPLEINTKRSHTAHGTLILFQFGGTKNLLLHFSSGENRKWQFKITCTVLINYILYTNQYNQLQQLRKKQFRRRK